MSKLIRYQLLDGSRITYNTMPMWWYYSCALMMGGEGIYQCGFKGSPASIGMLSILALCILFALYKMERFTTSLTEDLWRALQQKEQDDSSDPSLKEKG